MFREVIAVLDPAHLENLDTEMDRLSQALAQPGTGLRPVAERLVEIVSADIGHVAAREWTEDDLQAVLRRLVSPRLALACRTYSDAEQVTMGVQALVAALENKNVPGAQRIQATKFLTPLFEATADESSFQIGDFRQALADFRSSLPE